MRLTKKIQPWTVDQISEIHSDAFRGYNHSFLGNRYRKKLINWFAAYPRAITLVILEKKQILGYLLAVPTGYSKKYNRDLFPTVLVCLITRPWIILNRNVLLSIKKRVERQFFSRHTINIQSYLPSPIYNILAICIRKDQRRQGYGTLLINRFNKEAKKRKAKSLALSVYKTNNAARQFYRKNGWKIIPRYKDLLLAHYYKIIK